MGNPLRRRSDRIESGLTLTLVLLFVMAGPLLGWWAARSSYVADVRAAPPERDPVAQAVLVAGAVLLCLAAALAGIRAIGRAVLDRRRDREWHTEWQRVGPEWSRDRG